ncbi:MAG TPA: nucleoside triphosphate pyrophosphohydrolase, partial [Sediminispirochaeta sp.]|nr:nucleoside triphosphate pyrophosphohydrolase [Sediminispirochaeta sp.]
MAENKDYKEKLVPLDDGEARKLSESFLHFYQIIKTLRAPGGCPWDRKQTTRSLAPNLIEEVYELIDAIELEDVPNAREEIGDILLVVNMIATIFEEKKEFGLSEVLDEVSAKLVRRHPHVFGDVQKEDPEEVIELWQHIKKNVEKQGQARESIFDSVPRTMPPLERAYKLQKKASKVGFDWEKSDEVFNKLHEEIEELKEQVLQTSAAPDKIMDEPGDSLFSLINVSRCLEIDPAEALHR